jgi:5-methylcytosine-specific restriction endonuclease McrA
LKYPSKELDDVKWLTKKQSALQRDQFQCVRCFKTEGLEVHHTYYTDGYHLWDYPDDSLITLCRDCHQWWHDNFGIWYHVEGVKHPNTKSKPVKKGCKPRRKLPQTRHRQNKQRRRKGSNGYTRNSNVIPTTS